MGANLGPKQANTRSTDWRHHRTTPINIEKRFYTTKTPSGHSVAPNHATQQIKKAIYEGAHRRMAPMRNLTRRLPVNCD
jgi:hypothetical protein